MARGPQAPCSFQASAFHPRARARVAMGEAPGCVRKWGAGREPLREQAQLQ